MDDIALLQEYATQNSEQAFETLVSRHVNMVYPVAFRHLGNTHHAEEVTQAVFVILAKKSGNLRKGTILSGWLYQTARLTARNFLRGEIRRQQREQEAYMQSLTNGTESDVWPQIAPLLDDAMAQLGKKDRDAIALRFFEGKNLRDVGVNLGITEDAAKMRVSRAVERLRGFFSKRGVALSAAMISGAMAASSVQAAPVGLVSATTLAATKAVSLSTSTATLINGTLKLMAWTKIKAAVAIGLALFAAAGTTVVVVKTVAAPGNGISPRQILKVSAATYAAMKSYRCTGQEISEIEGVPADSKFRSQTGPQSSTFKIQLARPNLYRIEWEQPSPYFTNRGAVWNAGAGDFSMNISGRPMKEPNAKTSFAKYAGVSRSATAQLTSAFFENGSANTLVYFSTATDLTQETDEKIGGVDCFVFSKKERFAKGLGMPQSSRNRITIWIGKEDHLLHQRRTVSDDFKYTMPNGMGEIVAKKMTDTQTYEEIAVDEPATKESLLNPVVKK